MWVPSSQIEWTINKSNNQDDSAYTTEELRRAGITEWSLHVNVHVSSSPDLVNIRWVAIPRPVENLSSHDASRSGYPVIPLCDAEAQMAGVPSPTRNDGLPMYLAIINDGPTDTAICLPTGSEIIKAMRVFWSQELERGNKRARRTKLRPGSPSLVVATDRAA